MWKAYINVQNVIVFALSVVHTSLAFVAHTSRHTSQGRLTKDLQFIFRQYLNSSSENRFVSLPWLLHSTSSFIATCVWVHLDTRPYRNRERDLQNLVQQLLPDMTAITAHCLRHISYIQSGLQVSKLHSKTHTEIRKKFIYYLLNLQKLYETFHVQCTTHTAVLHFCKSNGRFKFERSSYYERIFQINLLLSHSVFRLRASSSGWLSLRYYIF
jgi:hypothetical protein